MRGSRTMRHLVPDLFGWWLHRGYGDLLPLTMHMGATAMTWAMREAIEQGTQPPHVHQIKGKVFAIGLLSLRDQADPRSDGARERVEHVNRAMGWGSHKRIAYVRADACRRCGGPHIGHVGTAAVGWARRVGLYKPEPWVPTWHGFDKVPRMLAPLLGVPVRTSSPPAAGGSYDYCSQECCEAHAIEIELTIGELRDAR